MTKFTQEDLVEYLYRDTSAQKTAAIKLALETDWDLRESLEVIASGKKNLDEINFSPREEAVNRVLQHITKKHGQLFPH